MPGDAEVLYRQEINAIPRLSPGKEHELLAVMAQPGESGREAVRILTKANLYLVVSAVAGYKVPSGRFLDLVQQGNLALISAIEQYDAKRGCSLAEYATREIEKALDMVADGE